RGGRTRPRFATSRDAPEAPPFCGVVGMVFALQDRSITVPGDLTVHRSARSDDRGTKSPPLIGTPFRPHRVPRGSNPWPDANETPSLLLLPDRPADDSDDTPACMPR